MTGPDATGWIDVSVTVRHGMPHWPDNPPIVLERVMDLDRGHARNVSHLAMGVHGGTHMDEPVHFIHRILLEAGIWIIEGPDLSAVTGGRYELICLAVKLHGSDGAPARAILRPVGGHARSVAGSAGTTP
jgi:kynurenine formamidase